MDIKIVCTEEELGRLADCAFKIYIDKSNEKLTKNKLFLKSVFQKAFEEFFGINQNIKFSNLSSEDRKEVICSFFGKLHKYQLRKNAELRKEILDFYK